MKRNATPSYKGLLIHAGGHVLVGPDDTRLAGSVGLGYGIWDDLLLIKNVSVSTFFMPEFYTPKHRLVVVTGGFGLDLPGDGLFRVVRFDIGPAFGISREFDDIGTALALGLDSRVIRTRVDDVGVTLRVRYQWFNLDRPLSGPALEIIWQ